MLYEVITMKKTIYKRGLQIALPLFAVLGMIGCTPTIHPTPDLLVQDKKSKVEKQIVDRPFKDVVITSYSIHYTKLYEVWPRPRKTNYVV